MASLWFQLSVCGAGEAVVDGSCGGDDDGCGRKMWGFVSEKVLYLSLFYLLRSHLRIKINYCSHLLSCFGQRVEFHSLKKKWDFEHMVLISVRSVIL